MANVRMKDKATSAVVSATKIWATNATNTDAPATPQSIADFTFSSASKTTDNLAQGATNKYYADSLVTTFLSSSTAKAINGAGSTLGQVATPISALYASAGTITNLSATGLTLGNASGITAASGLIKLDTRFQGYKAGSWVNLDYGDADVSTYAQSGSLPSVSVSGGFTAVGHSTLAGVTANGVLLGDGSSIVADEGLTKFDTRFQGYKAGSWVNLDYGDADVRVCTTSGIPVGTNTQLADGQQLQQVLANFQYQINQGGGGGSVTGTNGQVGYFTGTDELGGSNNFYWKSSINRLSINAGIDPSAALHVVSADGVGEDDLVGIFTASPGNTYAATLALVNNTGLSWKSVLSFRSATATEKWQMGIDSAGIGVQDWYVRDTVAGAYRLFIDSAGAIRNKETGDASACFELESFDRGFLMPRMTNAQRDAITAPAAGLMVFSTTEYLANMYAYSDWRYMMLAENVAAKAVPFYTTDLMLRADATRFNWDPDNHRLGIGTASPQYALDVKGDSGANAICARFSTTTGGQGTLRSNTIILDNLDATNRKNKIVFSANGFPCWAMGSDFAGTGGQNFFIYDELSTVQRLSLEPNKLFTESVIPRTDNAFTLGDTNLKWIKVFAHNGFIDTSDIRYKKDITTNILGSMSILYNDYFTTAKAVGNNVIRYKMDNSSLDSIGFDAGALFKMRFPGAKAFKNQQELMFHEVHSDDDVDMYGVCAAQLTAFNSRMIAEIIQVLENNNLI
jgi:hypothetical protein